MVGAERTGSFVGRASEIARLEQALRMVADAGSALAFVVGGEAGIGKTRLIERFADDVRARGIRVLVGACLPVGPDALPYLPVVEALRSLVRSVEPTRAPALLGPHRAELARLLPELETTARPPVRDGEDDRLARARLFEIVLGVFGRLADAGPAVLVVEDLQWADRSTLDLAAFLVRNLRESPILFVLSVRTDELGVGHPVLPFLAELERDTAERIDLPPLSRSEVRDLLAQRMGRLPAADRVATVAARTGGNPFFAEQLVAAAEEAGDAARLPAALRDVLGARLGSFSDSTRRVLRVAAAAGRRTDDVLLSSVSGLPVGDVADALREAVARGLLVEAEVVPGTVPHGLGGYAFHHALLQEVAYAELLPGERTRLHAACARALERRGEVGGVPVVPGEIAYHWVAARDPRRALPALVEAALAAERMYAFAEALGHYEAAFRLWPEVPDAGALVGHDRSWLLQRAAEMAMLAGTAGRAAELARQAIAELESSPEPDRRRVGELHGRLRWFLWEAGDRAGAVEALHEALRLIPEHPPSTARARALGQLAGLHLRSGRYEQAASTAEAALAHARAAGAGLGEEAFARGVLGWARAVLGDVDHGERTLREGIAIAERLGGAEGIALGYASLAALLDRVGRMEGALEAARDGFGRVERLGLARTYGGTLIGHAAKALFNLGRWDEAAAVLDRGFALDPTGEVASWLHVNRARLDTHRGDFETAAEHLRAAAHQGGRDHLHATALLAASAELAVWRLDVPAVRAAAADGLRYAEGDELSDPWLAWLAALVLRAEADAATLARARHDAQALEDGRRIARAIGSQLDRFGRVARAARDDALLTLCRAEVARLDDRDDPAAWRAVAQAWADVGRPFPVAYARFRAAEAILVSRGSREAAAAELRAAAATARVLGARPLLAEVERLARHARVELTERAPEAGERTEPAGGSALGLTAREAEVLALVAAGWSNQQIADRLFITRKTASVHVSNILGKLGAANPLEAAAIAHRLGVGSSRAPDGRDM